MIYEWYIIDHITIYMQLYYDRYRNDPQAIVLWSVYNQLEYYQYADNWYTIDDCNTIDWHMNDIQSIVLQSICNHIMIDLWTIYKWVYNDWYTIDWCMIIIDIQTIDT